MALQNEISIEFTDAELKTVDDALTQLESVFGPKLIQLTAEQNQMYGRLGNETGNWVEMVYSDCQITPTLVPAQAVDIAEWTKDETARKQLVPRLARLMALATNLDSTNRLIGFDLYNACLMTYKNVKTQMEMGIAGTKAFYDKWKIQFPGHGGGRGKTAATVPVK